MNYGTKEEPLVFIIMANYNGYYVTAGAIRSLRNLTYNNYLIVVVDDCSKDNSPIKLGRDFPKIKIISATKNGGLNKSYNLGIRYALSSGAEYVFLVQNDSKAFSPNIIEEMLKQFEKDKKIGMVGPFVLDSFGNYRWNGIDKDKFGIKMNISEGYIIKREVFEKIGLFNERLVVYFEDIDFIIRLRGAGFETHAAPEVSFTHIGSVTFTKQKFYPNYIRARNIPFFMRRYCKDKPLIWQIRTFLGNLYVHIDKMKIAFKKRDLTSLFYVTIGIFLGLVVGSLLPWREELPWSEET